MDKDGREADEYEGREKYASLSHANTVRKQQHRLTTLDSVRFALMTRGDIEI